MVHEAWVPDEFECPKLPSIGDSATWQDWVGCVVGGNAIAGSGERDSAAFHLPARSFAASQLRVGVIVLPNLKTVTILYGLLLFAR